MSFPGRKKSFCVQEFDKNKWCTAGLGGWPNIDQAQAPAPELTIFKSMAPTPALELVFRFMWSQFQSSFRGFTNVVKCNIFLAKDFTNNITIW